MKYQNRDKNALFRARKLRRGQTEGERIIWEHLRRSAMGFRFRRQFPVGPYVLDFYCSTAKLCVEIDGPDHEERIERDVQRDRFLAGLGIETLRMASLEVFDNIDGVLDDIVRACQRRTGWKKPGT